MFLAAQDWLSDQWIWLVFGVLFVLGVGVIWPLSDASYRDKARPLRPAKLSHWRSQISYTRAQTAFLWFDNEPPRREAEVEAWLKRNASLRVLYMQLCEVMGPDTGEADLTRRSLKLYAGERFEMRGERIPAFLRDPGVPETSTMKQITQDK